MTFTERDFTADAYGHGPRDKARVANQLVRLVEGDFAPTLFPNTLYKRLSLMFGHIAHYDRGGFYSVWMSTPAARARWLRYIGKGGAYGLMPLGRTDTWADVEHAFANWVHEHPEHVEHQEAIALAAIEADERAELARLTEKYKEEAI